MAKRERIPFEQRSPYGRTSNEDKMASIPFSPFGGRGDSVRALSEYMEEIRRTMFTVDGPNDFVFVDPAAPKLMSSPNALQFAEQKAREKVKDYLLTTDLQVSWEDVVGNEDAHRAMIEAIEFPIKHAELFKFYGKKMTKGILLSGPPGCGKTMLGKAAAGVISKLHGKDATMLCVNATDLQKPYIGQTEGIIRDLFAYARAYKALHGHQLVLFIDEADAILPDRGNSYRWEQSNVATFLTEMDGMEESAALVILATNRPHVIDSALLREGRIDRKIVVRRPEEAAARVILSKASVGAPFANDANRESLLDRTIEDMFSPLRHIVKIKTEKGTDYLTLGNCVSGAMVVGLIERAKASAFHRDIANGSMGGITKEDMRTAVDAIMAEQMQRLDSYALIEFAQRLNTPVLEIAAVQQPEIKFTGTLQ